MKKMLKPYQYNQIKYLAFNLLNTYHSVNDKGTQAAFYDLIATQISLLDDSPELQDFIQRIKDVSLTTESLEAQLESLRAIVEPFPLKTEAQMRRLFKKVKKLKIPASSIWDLRELSFFAWNDISSNRKYIVTADGQGFYGTLEGQTRNICAICRKTSNVTHFLATTKTGADGTYTKNGTYICLDSESCNRQIQSVEGLENFISIIKPK